MLNILWSERALRRRIEIYVAVAEYADVQSADYYMSEFDRVLDLAAANPKMGKIGIVPHTRELYPVKHKYRIVYEIQQDTIFVLTVKSCRQLHTAQDC